ncbi:dUTP diphosphatase [Diplonema papillatum]|nr:dUTP diphosphatase [Diplonema papillatum]|eukprot:gene21400-32909_t
MGDMPDMKRRKTDEDTVSAEVLEKLSGLQSGLNSLIAKGDWMKQRTPDDWALAVTLECAELMDSYPWKWWKNVKGKVDLNNVKIELVDILHFSLSGQMMVGSTDDHPASTITAPLLETANAIATFRHVIKLTYTHSFFTITRHVVEAAADLEFNIVSYYIAKHTLNYIRQLGGYKDGTYTKVNKGVEDNELLHQCIEGITLKDMSEDFDGISNSIMTKVYDIFQVDASNRKVVSDWLAAK